MAISVSSWFIEQLSNKNPDLVVQFTIGSSDYSGYVNRWPTIRKSWDDARTQKVSLTLANNNKAFNFLIDDKTKMRETCSIKIGFHHVSSGDELISVFTGTTEKVVFSEGYAKVTLADKFSQLADRVMGTKDSPVTFTDSALPSDLAWSAVTSYGGFSAIASDSNPDIDYASYLEWSSVFSNDLVYMNGNIEGIKVSEVLKRISQRTLSAIYVDHENKLTFKRFSLIDSASLTLSKEIVDISIGIDITDTVNKHYVYGGYVPDSRSWGIVVYNELTSSVNSFGLKEEVDKDDAIWYVTSGSAINMAQRKTLTAGAPYDNIEIQSTLLPLSQRIGDNIRLVDSFYDIDAGFRLMGYSVNLHTGVFKCMVDRSQYGNPFVLDVSTLDGTDVLI